MDIDVELPVEEDESDILSKSCQTDCGFVPMRSGIIFECVHVTPNDVTTYMDGPGHLQSMSTQTKIPLPKTFESTGCMTDWFIDEEYNTPFISQLKNELEFKSWLGVSPKMFKVLLDLVGDDISDRMTALEDRLCIFLVKIEN